MSPSERTRGEETGSTASSSPGEEFRLRGGRAEIARRIRRDLGCLDEFSSAGDLNHLLEELCPMGILECPAGLEIIVYPGASEEGDAVVTTVFSRMHPDAHVVASSREMRKFATRELWEGPDTSALTVAIVEELVGVANGAVGAVRRLERATADRPVVAPAHCPRCGAEQNLRVEYRHDLLGLSADRDLVLADGDLSEIFCLACREEVDCVLGPEGPVLVAGGGRGAGG